MKGFVRSSENKNRTPLVFVGGALFLLLSVICGILFGSSGLTAGEIISGVTGKSETALKIIYYVRLPRTLACVCAGAALATSGAVIPSPSIAVAKYAFSRIYPFSVQRFASSVDLSK